MFRQYNKLYRPRNQLRLGYEVQYNFFYNKAADSLNIRRLLAVVLGLHVGPSTGQWFDGVEYHSTRVFLHASTASASKTTSRRSVYCSMATLIDITELCRFLLKQIFLLFLILYNAHKYYAHYCNCCVDPCGWTWSTISEVEIAC